MHEITVAVILFGIGLCVGWLFGRASGRAQAWFEYKRDRLRGGQAAGLDMPETHTDLRRYFGPDHPDDIERQRGEHSTPGSWGACGEGTARVRVLTAEEAGRSVT